jgi:peptidoglycan/xylan/chitin deacetylase (PgdA/CDA1 family)
MYHRVAEAALDPHRLCVTPANFDQQLQVLRETGPVLRLAEVAERIAARRPLPRRASVVTFDDGYADNLYAAKPLLERHGVPATFFVTTGAVGRRREFWWDELERLLLGPHPLPQVLPPDVLGAGEVKSDFSDESPGRAEPAESWDFTSRIDPTPRHRLYRVVYDRLHPRTPGEIDEVLTRLADWAGQPPGVRPAYRAIDPPEIVALGRGPLVEIGGHTVNHPNLATQAPELQRHEIAQNKRALEECLGRSVDSFSYPYGEHTPQTVAIAAESGFRRACTTRGHAVRRGSEVYRLTRVAAPDCGAADFERWLSRAFVA